MKIKKILTLLIPMLALPTMANTLSTDTDTVLVEKYADSLRVSAQHIDSLYNAGCRSNGLSAYSRYMLFGMPTFYHSVSSGLLSLNNNGNQESMHVNTALYNMYISNPSLITNSENRLKEAGTIREDNKTPIRREDVEYKKQTEPIPDDVVEGPVQVVVKKPNFWKFSGEYNLQFIQNFVSENWHKGGESNYSMMANAVLQANYNNKQKVKFDNKLEMRLGMQTSNSDTLHTLKTTEDLLRYTGKLGLQATKRWYYTMQLIAYTQFMRGYKSNNDFVFSDFMSPFNANLSVGMSYNVDALKSKLKGTIQLSPLAYNFKYVDRLSLATRHGLEEGKHTKHDYGSSMTADLTWEMSQIIKWKTRLYGYTTYEKAELEWENTFIFQLSKYITSNLFIYPRFDDGVKRDEKNGYWQFKEYLSLGLSYSF